MDSVARRDRKLAAPIKHHITTFQIEEETENLKYERLFPQKREAFSPAEDG